MIMGTPFLQALRFQNLFGPQDPNQIDPRVNLRTGAGTFSGQPMIPDQGPDISQVNIGPEPTFQPEHRAQDAMWKMMEQFPERNNPGMLRKIAAMGAGIGYGPEMAQYAMYAPYMRQMEDFQPKFKAYSDMANQERMSNNTLRQISADAARNQTADRRLDIADREQQRKEREGQQNIAIRKKRAATYDFKARNPNLKIETDKEGRLIGINQATGESQFITGADGQPVMSHELSAEDKANLQIQVARERGKITEGIQRRMEDYRQVNREKTINLRADKRAQAKTSDKAMSASQEAAAWKLAKDQYIADNPRNRHFWDERGQPTDSADDDDEYTAAMDDIRRRFNVIKARATKQAPTVTPVTPMRSSPTKTTTQSAPASTKQQMSNGTPPPIQNRTKGMKHKFPNGNVGEWDGTKWIPVTVVSR